MSLWRAARSWGWRLLAAWMTFGLTGSGCASISRCETALGFQADEVPVGWTCQDVQAVETAIVRELQQAQDKRYVNCSLRGYKLVVIDVESWWSFGRMVAGLTYCQNGNVIIGNSPPRKSALAHEMVHALQNCYPLGPYDEKDFYHSNWRRDGIYDAIDRATDSLDAGR